MGVPKYKPSKSRQRKRRTHDSLTPPNLAPCGSCGRPVPRHRVCPNCGHYPTRKTGARTRQVIVPAES